MPDAEETRISVKVIQDPGGFDHQMQEIRIEYLEGNGPATPKAVIAIRTTAPGEDTPRSFRTDKPGVLRDVVIQLTKCLHRMEYDIKEKRKKMVNSLRRDEGF